MSPWPPGRAAGASGFDNDDKLLRAYQRIEPGMPASQLTLMGFDTGKAERLSKLALMENFMPKDSSAFDALDPAVQDCYTGREDCNAFIFVAMGAQAVLLVNGGRVTWKSISGVTVAQSRAARTKLALY